MKTAVSSFSSSIIHVLSPFRGASVVRELDTQALQESHAIVTFLANKDEIANNLKKKLEKVEGHDEILADIVNLSTSMFEKKQFVLPSEKHMLIKVITDTNLYRSYTTSNRIFGGLTKNHTIVCKNALISSDQFESAIGRMMVPKKPYPFLSFFNVSQLAKNK